MKLRKLAAFGLAATLVAAPVTVFADDATAPVTGEEATVAGDVNYVDKTVYKVTLPTTTGLDFALDPQGLATLEGENATYDATKSGQVVGGDGTVCINKSSIPIKLTASFYVTDGAGNASTAATLIKKTDTIDNDANQVNIQIIPDAGDLDAAAVADLSEYTGWATASGVDVTATSASAPTKVVFALAEAEYEFTGNKTSGYTYSPKAAATGVVTETYAGFKIGGKVSKDADWSAFTKATNPETLVLHCVFSFEGLKEIGEDATADGTGALVVDEAKLTGLVNITTSATITKGATDDLVLNAKDTIQSVKLTKWNGAAASTVFDTSKATISGNTATILGTWLTKATQDFEITLTLADGTTQVIPVTVATE